jgi:hypothetical protein
MKVFASKYALLRKGLGKVSTGGTGQIELMSDLGKIVRIGTRLSGSDTGLNKGNTGLSKCNTGLNKRNTGLNKGNTGLKKSQIGIPRTGGRSIRDSQYGTANTGQPMPASQGRTANTGQIF